MTAGDINEFYTKFYKLNQENHSYNPHLRISKPTDSRMQVYKKSVIGRIIYRSSIIKFFLPLILILRLVLNSAYNLTLFLLYRKPKVELTKVDIVFLSHLTNRNMKSNKDSFYGSLPEEFIKRGKKVGIIYSNQTHTLSKSIINKLEESNNYVVPKYLHLAEFFQYCNKVWKSIKYTLTEGKKYCKTGPDVNFLISKACLSFLKFETMKNFHLINESVTVLSKYQPTFIFLTFEGHIYENAIYLNCESQSHVQRILMFQNSPIVASQVGAFDFVRSHEKKLAYIVQGSAYRSLILSLKESADVLNIGAISGNEIIQGVKEDWPSERVILIPDGDKANIKYLMDLSKSKIRRISADVTISFHPDTSIGVLNRIKLIHLKRSGVIRMSRSNLNLNDLTDYSIVVYTSSSLSIACLSMGKKLIYVNNSTYDVNPLWLLRNKQPVLGPPDYDSLGVHTYPISEYWNLRSQVNYEPLFELVSQ
jgi:hypothetical protein